MTHFFNMLFFYAAHPTNLWDNITKSLKPKAKPLDDQQKQHIEHLKDTL